MADQVACLAAADVNPLPVSSADSLYLWDEMQREILDYAAVLNPLGHRNESIMSSVADHLRYYGLTGPQGRHLLRWPVAYARQLSDEFSVPGQTFKVLFCEGEREAVLKAADLACHRSGRGTVAVLDTGWHDWFPVGRDLIQATDPTSRLDPDVHGALLLSVVDVVANPVASCREWVLAARESNIPVVVDESVTGFGRTGMVWGQEHTGLVADLTVLGGPVGGGLPLGAVVARPDYFGPGVTDTSPHAGHPWACAAGSALLSGIKSGVVDHVADCADPLQEALDGLCQQFPEYLSGHQGLGLYRGLNFCDPALAEDFPQMALASGLHLAPAVGTTVVLAPVLVSSIHEIKRGVDLIADTLMSWDNAPEPS